MVGKELRERPEIAPSMEGGRNEGITVEVSDEWKMADGRLMCKEVAGPVVGARGTIQEREQDVLGGGGVFCEANQIAPYP